MAIPIQSPLSYYLHVGEQAHKQNVRERLTAITANVVIDRDANAKTVAEYNQYSDAVNMLSKTMRAKKTARNWGIFAIIFIGLTLSILLACWI